MSILLNDVLRLPDAVQDVLGKCEAGFGGGGEEVVIKGLVINELFGGVVCGGGSDPFPGIFIFGSEGAFAYSFQKNILVQAHAGYEAGAPVVAGGQKSLHRVQLDITIRNGGIDLIKHFPLVGCGGREITITMLHGDAFK